MRKRWWHRYQPRFSLAGRVDSRLIIDYIDCGCFQMCCGRVLLTSWVLVLAQLRCVEPVPISMDKTKVKEPEQKAEEPPASVVRRHTRGRSPPSVCAVVIDLSLDKRSIDQPSELFINSEMCCSLLYVLYTVLNVYITYTVQMQHTHTNG